MLSIVIIFVSVIISLLYIISCIGQPRRYQIIPDHASKSLILLVYFFLGLTILLFCSLEPFFMGAVPLPVPICMPFNLLEAPPDLMVLDLFMAVCLATRCRFWAILAPLSGFSLALQVLALATTLPFLVPDVHLNPCFKPLPATRLNTRLMPSAMAESVVVELFEATTACGTRSCALIVSKALGIFGMRISEIFIAIFISLTGRIKP